MPTKIKWKIQTCFTLNFKFWEGISVKSYKTQLPVSLLLVLHQFLYQQISVLQLSRISFNIIWKGFSSYIFLCKQIHPPSPQPHPINGQNLLNVTKVFCQFFLKCLLNFLFFSKIYWQNPAKHFLKIPTTDSLVFFSDQFYMFNLSNFIFWSLIWRMITVYFLRFDYWTLEEC